MGKLIKAFVKKELVQALRDPRMKFVLFVTPIVQLAVFGLALENQAQNIRFYARPMMNDIMLTDITRDATASGWFIPVEKGEGYNGEDIDSFKNGTLDMAIYASQNGLTHDFENGHGRLEAVIDGYDLIRARGMNSYLNSIAMRVASERLGRPQDYAYQKMVHSKPNEALSPPIAFITRVLYNPEFKTSFTLVPGVICMLTCIITIMLTSMSIAKEKEIGTFETLISAPVTIGEVILGKTIPYMIIGGVNIPMIFFVAVAVFHVPMRGSYLFLAIATFFFLITTVSIGTMISAIAKSQQQAMMGSFIFLMPAILLSGIMYPIDNLPAFLRVIAWFNPLMYYTTLLKNIMLKGGDWFVVLSYTGATIIIAMISVATAFKKFKLHLG